jgi:hypothetical protein
LFLPHSVTIKLVYCWHEKELNLNGELIDW